MQFQSYIIHYIVSYVFPQRYFYHAITYSVCLQTLCARTVPVRQNSPPRAAHLCFLCNRNFLLHKNALPKPDKVKVKHSILFIQYQISQLNVFSFYLANSHSSSPASQSGRLCGTKTSQFKCNQYKICQLPTI